MTTQGTVSNVNLRPANQPDAHGYSPHRDLAYVYPQLMRTAFTMLDKKNWVPEFAERMQKLQLTEDDLAVGVERFVNALELFIRNPDITTPLDAFRRTQFDALCADVRQALFEKFGEVLTGGWFVAVRDVTLRGQMSDAAEYMVAMLAAGRIVANNVHHRGVVGGVEYSYLERAIAEDAEIRVAELTILVQEVERAQRQSAEDVKTLRRALSQKDADVASMDFQLRTLRGEYGEVSHKNSVMVARAQALVTPPWFMRILLGARIFMRIILKRDIFHVDGSGTSGTVEGDHSSISHTH